MSALRRIATVGTPPNRVLRFGLAVIVLAVELIALRDLILVTGHGIDLEIPLRAADRWIHGGQPYLAESFHAPPGPDLPFLYPPPVLPFVSLLLALPRDVVVYGWMAICAVAAAAACWRLRIPARWWLFFLAWPPFAEGIIVGNVQVVLFLCFTLLFFRVDAPGPSFHPLGRDPTDRAHPAPREGILAALIAAFKVAELQSWVYLLFRRPGAALLGAAVIVALALLTLPIVGLPVWGDWVAQIRRAADPNWTLAGISLGRYVGPVLGLGIFAVTVALLPFVPRARAGVWVGLLTVLGAPSLHTYGILFLLPATLMIRRELALVAAFFLSTYTELGMWIGIAIVAVTFISSTRLAWLAEPVPTEPMVAEPGALSGGPVSAGPEPSGSAPAPS